MNDFDVSSLSRFKNHLNQVIRVPDSPWIVVAMTSFVREILSSAGRLDSKEDLRSATDRVEKSLKEAKAGMAGKVRRHYGGHEAAAHFAETSSQAARLKDALDEVESLNATLRLHLGPELREANAEMAEWRRQLDAIAETVSAANRIRDAYAAMEEANRRMEEGRFLDATERLAEVDRLVNVVVDDGKDDEEESAAMEAVREEYVSAMETVHERIGGEWDERVKIEDEKENGGIRMSLTPLSGDLVRTLNNADMMSLRLSKFGHRLQSKVLAGIIGCSTASVEQINSEVGAAVFVVKLSAGSKGRPHPQDVFRNLYAVLEPIFNVMNVPVTKDEATTLVHLLGDSISGQLMSALVSDCLSPAVPSTKEDLPQFRAVLKSAETFHNALKEVGFVKEGGAESNELSNYCENTSAIFADRRVASILGKAREIMKEPLHTVKDADAVATMEDSEVKHELGLTGLDLKAPVSELEGLSLPEGVSADESLFAFPKCQVSEHVFKVRQKLPKETT